MNKIKDLKVNQMTNITLVVTSAVARETKAKKPYLQLELFDGSDTIQANYWDWLSGNIPEKNLIVDVSAQVTEYLGTKQLNIKTMSANTTLHLSDFAPSSGVSIGDVYREAIALATSIQDDFLRSLTLACLEDLQSKWCKIPGAKGVHHAFVGGTLVHSVSTAKIAYAISRQCPDSNDDLCIAGALLHDIGKLYTYKIDGITIDMTDYGKLYDHTFMGAEFIGNFAENIITDDPRTDEKLTLLRHIILSHHGCLEYGAAVPPMCIEAHIVSHADGIDAEVQQVIEASRKLSTDTMWTDRIYTLSNRQQLTPQYVQDVMAQRVSNDAE